MSLSESVSVCYLLSKTVLSTQSGEDTSLVLGHKVGEMFVLGDEAVLFDGESEKHVLHELVVSHPLDVWPREDVRGQLVALDVEVLLRVFVRAVARHDAAVS